LIPQPIDTIPLFQKLTEEERQIVTTRLKRRQAAPGELIISEGQPSDTLYIITAGWVKIEGGSVDHAVTLANLSAGSLIGEMDILLNRPYAMTARSAANTQLLTLSRTDLEDLISAHPGIGLKFGASLGVRVVFLEQYLVQQRLRNIELLSALSEDDLRAIAERLDFRSAARGDIIVEAGAPGDAAFLIEEGHVRLIIKSTEGETFEELDEGDVFGHTALITGKPHTTTARAVTDVTTWVLSRAAYQDLIQRHPAIKLAFSRALAASLSPGDQSDAVEQMRQMQLFSDVPTEALSALTTRLVLRHFPAEEAIYTEGTPGDALYIVESGEVKLLDSSFSGAQLLERVRPGESFGEMALLTGRTRAECARAATDTTVWALYKSDFDDVMVQYPEISVSLSRALTERLSTRESDFVIRHLRRIKLFSNLASSELRGVSQKVRGLRFRPGEIICFAGQPTLTLFMIENGEVKRMAMGPTGEPIMLAILNSGDCFGEQSIIQNTPYDATAQAIGEVELWTISKADFQALMEHYPTLAITVTRMMAERLSRAQQLPPPMRGQPRGGAPTPPRVPTVRPGATVPPPGRRIRQPPSGARPITPAPKPAAPSPRPAPGAPNAPAQPRGTPTPPKPPTTHRANIIGVGVTRQHNVPHTQPHATQQHATHVLPHAARLAPPPAHARAPKPAARPRAPREENVFFKELGEWVTGLSIGAKLRVAVLGLLLVWFVVIAGPVTTVSTVSSAVGGLQILNPSAPNADTTQKATVAAPPRDTGNNNPKIAFAVPTNTPVPTRTPLPTFTPRPKPTLAPATRTPAPPPAAAASAATAIPTLPPAYIDARLGTGPQVLPLLDKVKIIPANVARGQKFWRVTSLKFEDITESGSDHSIYVKIFDESGKRTEAKLKLRGEGSGDLPDPEQKKADDICDCNYGIGMWGDGYGVQIVDQYPSEQVVGMIMPMNRHVNYRIAFQLSTMP